MNEFHFRRAMGIVSAWVPRKQGLRQKLWLQGHCDPREKEETGWPVLWGLLSDPTRDI